MAKNKSSATPPAETTGEANPKDYSFIKGLSQFVYKGKTITVKEAEKNPELKKELIEAGCGLLQYKKQKED